MNLKKINKLKISELDKNDLHETLKNDRKMRGRSRSRYQQPLAIHALSREGSAHVAYIVK